MLSPWSQKGSPLSHQDAVMSSYCLQAVMFGRGKA